MWCYIQGEGLACTSSLSFDPGPWCGEIEYFLWLQSAHTGTCQVRGFVGGDWLWGWRHAVAPSLLIQPCIPVCKEAGLGVALENRHVLHNNPHITVITDKRTHVHTGPPWCGTWNFCMATSQQIYLLMRRFVYRANWQNLSHTKSKSLS